MSDDPEEHGAVPRIPPADAAALERARVRDEEAERKRERLKVFFATLAIVFMLGWLVSYLGAELRMDLVHYVGLGLVGAPLLVLMLWLGHQH